MLHMLTSHSASCINRNDDGLPKDMMYGGAKRFRISSQCLCRSLRKSPFYEEVFGEASIRTRSVEDMIEYMSGLSEFKNTDPKVIAYVVNAGIKDGTTVAWLPEEFRRMVSVVERILKENGATPDMLKIAGVNSVFTGMKKHDSDENPDSVVSGNDASGESLQKTTAPDKKKNGKSSPLDKKLAQAVKEELSEANKAGISAFDIALKGRMCANGALSTIEGAMSIAHAFTTHAVDSDVDYFVAMDDLCQLGAGHINDQEFGSGTFYEFAVIDLDLLAKNRGYGTNRKKALEDLAPVFKLMSMISPSGKQHSFASFPYAEYVMVVLSDNPPLSLASAFETPVESNSGYMDKSIVALEKQWKALGKAYGNEDDKVGVFTSRKSLLGESNVPVFDEMAKLIDWIKA